MTNKCKHDWLHVGVSDNGFGYSTDCPVYWCKNCGAIERNNRTKNPKIVLRKRKKDVDN